MKSSSVRGSVKTAREGHFSTNDSKFLILSYLHFFLHKDKILHKEPVLQMEIRVPMPFVQSFSIV